MSTVRFETVIGDERIMYLPYGIELPRGKAEVTVVTQEAAKQDENLSLRAMIDRLARVAEEDAIKGGSASSLLAGPSLHASPTDRPQRGLRE